MSTDPRADLRAMIAEKIDQKMRSERMDDYFDGGDYADAVMELFPDADVERELRVNGAVLPARWPEDAATHTRYVLRTAPERWEAGGPVGPPPSVPYTTRATDNTEDAPGRQVNPGAAQ